MRVQLPFLLRAVVLTDALNEIDRLAVVNEEFRLGSLLVACVCMLIRILGIFSQRRSFPIKLLSRRGSADAR